MSYIGNTQQNQSYVPAVDFFNGNGSTTAFTLSKPVASVAQIQAVINNVPQKPGDAYTVSGSTITFTSAPPSGTNNIYVYYTSPNTYVMEPGQGTVGTSKIADGAITPAKLSTGYPYWDTSGNVGIGTSSPQTTLDVYNSTNPVISLRKAGDASTGLQIGRDNSTLDAFIIQRENAALFFRTNNTERMRIDSSGRVQIGTTATNPANANTYGIVLGVDGAGSAYAGASQFSTNGTAAIILNRGADSGTTMAFKQAGTTVGGVNVTGSSTSYATSSDYRLKENIQPMQNALDKVTQLNPVTYTWKADGSDGQGFIAHELQAVVPDCVTGEKDAVDAEGKPVYQGIDTSFLVATLTKAIQELSAKNDALEARITALEAK